MFYVRDKYLKKNKKSFTERNFKLLIPQDCREFIKLESAN